MQSNLMKTDMEGRIKNTDLPAYKPLLPLYEAIINALQAIEDNKKKDGLITIEIFREETLIEEEGKRLGDITMFIVTDNGIGFNDANFNSFLTSDSTFKIDRGGKGVGRFLWLKAFGQVEIESIYLNGDNKFLFRKFDFISKGDGIQNHQLGISEENNPKTTIRLMNYYEQYRKLCPKKVQTIAIHIIEHFLEYFRNPNCPVIELIDNENDEKINLNQLFEAEISTNSKIERFDIKNVRFDFQHVKLYTFHNKEHFIHYCADDRVALSEKVIKIPNLIAPLQDDKGKFVYACYVESSFLNKNANSTRTGFNIAEDNSELQIETINLSDIKKNVLEKVKEYLEPFTNPVKAQKEERIKRFVENEAPEYRPILNHIKEHIDEIDPNIDDKKLDVELYKAYQSLQITTKKEGQALLAQDSSKIDNFDEYSEKFRNYFKKAIELNNSNLARYVCHRKAVIDFLNKQLELQNNEKYNRENQIHDIIFPMGKTSNEVPEDSHNLWLLDERLVYHTYLASDKQLRTLKPLDNNSSKEPDIIIFDKACAFVDEEAPFSHVTIFELKRPMRSDYQPDDDPVDQVYGYIRDIRDGKAKNEKGRPIEINSNTPFYCYILCDITQKIATFAENKSFRLTPDGKGYYGFNDGLHAYVEIISYDKMLRDAKKRNDVFFKKLGIATQK